MTNQKIRPNTTTRISYRPIAIGIASLFGIAGVAACGDEVKDVLSFAEYVGASADVLDANGFERESDIDCDGDTDTNEVTCTGTTTTRLPIASSGENLGEDSATLVVIVDGEVLYDGLLDDASQTSIHPDSNKGKAHDYRNRNHRNHRGNRHAPNRCPWIRGDRADRSMNAVVLPHCYSLNPSAALLPDPSFPTPPDLETHDHNDTLQHRNLLTL